MVNNLYYNSLLLLQYYKLYYNRWVNDIDREKAVNK